MNGGDVPATDTVIRYVKGSAIGDDNSVDGSAFRLRDGEKGLSVHWLEAFAGLSKPEQLSEVRRLMRLTPRNSARFAELNVGQVVEYILEEGRTLRVVSESLDATDEFEQDPSHAEIKNLPSDEDVAALIGDMIAKCITELHKAKA